MSRIHPQHRTRRTGWGFSLVEVLIVACILGLLAVMVVPQFSSASKIARESSLRDDLHYLRSQIMVYRAQHQGVSPGYPKSDTSAAPTFEAFLGQMTHCTDAAGLISETPSSDCRFGPYLMAIPVNMLNGSAAIRLIGPGPFPDRPQGGQGWVYQPSTGAIALNVPGRDSGGVAFFNY